MRTTAAVVPSTNAPFEMRELELDDPGPDEVVVRMVASGVCHTDQVLREQLVPIPLPAVLGHEGAGVVEAVGPGVTTVAVGDHVVLSFNSCGHCAQCDSGAPGYCAEFAARNIGGTRPDGSTAFRDGDTTVSSHFFGQSSFAAHSVVSARSLVVVDRDLPLDLLGPLGCGIQTGAGAVLNSLDPEAGSTIAIYGAGAVGDAAILAAVVAGCSTIIAVDTVAERIAFARDELGATHGIDASSEDPVERILEITGGRGVDYALETTGVGSVLRQTVDSLAVRGVAGLLGQAPIGTEVALETAASLLKGWTLTTIIEGDAVPRLFIPRLIELWRAGRFPFDKLVRHYDFADNEQAFTDSAEGRTIKPVLRFPGD